GRDELPWENAEDRISTPKGLRLGTRHTATTPSGLKSTHRPTQGSSSLATLGFGPESRWDSTNDQTRSTPLRRARILDIGHWAFTGHWSLDIGHSKPGHSKRRHLHGFSLLEMMVAVTLLLVIIAALLTMFYQTQRAFRLSATQVDVLEAGRAAMELLT